MIRPARALVAVAVLGLGGLVAGAGPGPATSAGPGAPRGPEDGGGVLEPIGLRPIRLVYRQMEGMYLKAPGGVWVDQVRGEVYVADTMNDLVAVYDRDGMPVFTFGYNGEFKEPMKAVADGRGRIYVLSGVGRKVRVFSYRGEPLGDFAFPGAPAGVVPTAMTADREGQVYVADLTSGQILVYDADQQFKLALGNGDGGAGRLRAVQAIVVGPNGDIYVADAQAVPIQVFSRDGRFLRGWGAHGTGPQAFSLPGGLALDADGRLIVVDTIRQSVSLFTPDGGLLARFGGFGTRAGAVAFPSDVASDGERRLFVVERAGNRLQIFDEQALPASARGANRSMPSRELDAIRRSLSDFMKGGSK